MVEVFPNRLPPDGAGVAALPNRLPPAGFAAFPKSPPVLVWPEEASFDLGVWDAVPNKDGVAAPDWF